MYDKSLSDLHMGSREPLASGVLGYCDVIFQIAGQQQRAAAGHTYWWSPRLGDHRGISTGYGGPAHAGESFSTTKAVVSKNWKLSTYSEFELFSEVEKESAHEEARSQQRMLKTGEVQDVLQQPRETQISDIDGLGDPIVAVTRYSSDQGMLKTGDVQEVHPPDAEKRGSP